MVDQWKKNMITTLRKMMSRSVRLMDKISHAFELDIFWRILCSLPHRERFYLALRVLQDDVDKMVFRKNGVLWTGYSWDSSIAWPLLVDGHYQGREINALISWMKKHGRLESDQKVIIEVGANIGTTSIPLALNTNSHILAIEPVPGSFALLRENVVQNGLQDRVTCVQKAISRQPGTAQMALAKHRCGGAAIKQDQPNFTLAGNSQIKEIVDVHTDSLMNIMASFNLSPDKIAFVWSDTEGSEAQVIETGRQLWLAGVPLFMELYPGALEKQNALASFENLVNEFYDRFVESSDLIKHGAHARIQPIAEISRLIDHHIRDNGLTDVLLLPRGYEFNSQTK